VCGRRSTIDGHYAPQCRLKAAARVPFIIIRLLPGLSGSAQLLCAAPADINSCNGNRCALDPNSTGECLDVRVPFSGYTCKCKFGTAWDTGSCKGALNCLTCACICRCVLLWGCPCVRQFEAAPARQPNPNTPEQEWPVLMILCVNQHVCHTWCASFMLLQLCVPAIHVTASCMPSMARVWHLEEPLS
jgi:hypothetical protein